MIKLPIGIEYVKDISILVNALYELEVLEKKNGKPYVFKYIQQRMLGGTCYAVPADATIRENDDVRLLGVYDKQYIKERIDMLRKNDLEKS